MEKYDNLGMVGEGSYGMVMKCKHKESGQIVAIKKFLESEDDKMVKKIAMREVRMLRKLRHENLVNLIEVFRRRKRLYLVFEFVDHTVLDDLEKYPNGLSELSVRKILWQVLRGVEFCHSHNIIHRDIKPENILNSRSGVIKLCDFGFARTLAAPGEVYTDYVATRWYRAPELLVGDTKYGRAVDIWAVGCLVGEMLLGDPIFPGKSDIDQLSRILKCVGNLCPRHREIFQRNPLFAGMRLPDVRDVDPLEKKFPKFSSEVLDLMKQCLRLDPNDRPSSSMLLRHEFFKKDNFEEKVIPELRARILKDAANSMLSRKDANKDQEKEKRKKKAKEIISNSGVENQAASDSSINASKKSPDQKSLQSNSPKKLDSVNSTKKSDVGNSPKKSDLNTSPKKSDLSNSPKKADLSNSPKKADLSNSPKKADLSNSPKKADLSNSPKKADLSNSPKKADLGNSQKKQEASSSKKENLPKSILKTSSNPITSGSDAKTQRREAERNQDFKVSNESSNFPKHLPNVDSAKQVTIAEANTPRPSFSKSSFKDQSPAALNDKPVTNMPQISKKRSSEDLYFKSTSRDGLVPSFSSDKVKSEKSRKSSTKRETLFADGHEQRQLSSSDKNLLEGKKMKNAPVSKVSSDTVIMKERSNHAVNRDAEQIHGAEHLINSKLAAVYTSESKHFRKEAFSKSPKHTDSPLRKSIPPIANQRNSKNSSPELNVFGTSPTSSTPPHTTQKPPIAMNSVSVSTHKNVEKTKKHGATKMNDSSPQGSFDRSMYPDKTSHFEKMMISMSGTTAITHPALKKAHPVPTSQPHLASVQQPSNATGASNMQYHRHYRDDKYPNLPLWSSSIVAEEKSPSLHSSLDSNFKVSDAKLQRASEDLSKPREKSLKHGRKENKNRNYNLDERALREYKTDSQVTRLPDLSRKQINTQDLSTMKFGISEGAKVKKNKSKTLTGMPTLDVTNMNMSKADRGVESPSPASNTTIEGNFPSVYTKN